MKDDGPEFGYLATQPEKGGVVPKTRFCVLLNGRCRPDTPGGVGRVPTLLMAEKPELWKPELPERECTH